MVAAAQVWTDLRAAPGPVPDQDWQRMTRHTLLCADYSTVRAIGRAARPEAVLKDVARQFPECFNYDELPAQQPAFYVRRDGLSVCQTPFAIDPTTNDFVIAPQSHEERRLYLCAGTRQVRSARKSDRIDRCADTLLLEARFPAALVEAANNGG